MQIQISWLLQKPTDLDLHCLQRQDISGFSRTSVNICMPITYILVVKKEKKARPICLRSRFLSYFEGNPFHKQLGMQESKQEVARFVFFVKSAVKCRGTIPMKYQALSMLVKFSADGCFLRKIKISSVCHLQKLP